MSMSQYMSVFIDESREHLQLMNDSLLEFEQDTEDVKIVNEIFRAAHTLKGMSATMGFNRIAELTHHMENVLDNIRNGVSIADGTTVDILFECLDTLNLLVDEVIETGQETTEVSDLMSKLDEMVKGAGKTTTKPSSKIEKKETPEEKKEEIQAEKEIDEQVEFNEYEKEILAAGKGKEMAPYLIKVELDEGCLLKAARTYMVFRNLEEIGEVIKSIPSVQELEEEKFDNSFLVAFISKKSIEEIKNSILEVSEVKDVLVSDIDINMSEKTEAREIKAVKKISEKQNKVKKSKSMVKKTTTTVRVDTEKLDLLMNLVGELVINKTRLAQLGLEYNLQDLSETLSHVDRVTSDIQAVVTKVRMVPIETVFNRFPRMVRDLSKDLGKDIDLIIEGKETELDRTVIDEIGDPLVHLIRNSVDHGVELPDKRESKGKPRTGTILLKAEHEGNSVVITIKDDGKGMDTEVLANKAIEKGILTLEEVEKLSHEEKLNLIFAPGFSTASEITDLSGRGVGMDVVKTKIEALSGSIEMSSEVDKGTETRIKLPLTLAIIEALMIKLEEEVYAIPLANIVETIDIAKEDIRTVQNEKVILLRGEIVPILNLSSILEVKTEKPEIEDRNTVVIVKAGNKKIGFIVDVLIGQQEIVIKSLGKMFQGTKGITGATVLGNGEVALILDVLTLV
ncbi:two-component system chemotaxis sensor kinase CheA [Hypnocyclicus thermotrophus]|uniref:Chemotaxis protein CheA n=1 Tax=Hypnocyclicus thermotrophus TaxID=1627895 RepID=A0AA46DXM3_9FUSO|nr:chemotaxis protein CheA [Hypnocyclicus thermotrophus]TDT68567.1 two-component system chemotaxis sensor kinase CheA [Hypnocyclicus thermotrophus]